MSSLCLTIYRATDYGEYTKWGYDLDALRAVAKDEVASGEFCLTKHYIPMPMRSIVLSLLNAEYTGSMVYDVEAWKLVVGAWREVAGAEHYPNWRQEDVT